MINIIKMDLYRLIKSKGFLVISILTIVFAAFVIFAFSLFVTKTASYTTTDDGGVLVIGQSDENNADDDSFKVGFSTAEDEDTFLKLQVKKLMFSELLSMVMNGFLLLAIIVPIFVNEDNKNGYIKNIAGLIPNKGGFAVSKIISIAVLNIYLILLQIVTVLISSRIFLGYLNFTAFGEFIPKLLLQILFGVSVSVFIAMLAVWFRSKGFSMMIGILMASGIFGGIATGINYLIEYFFKIENVDIAKCFISSYSNITTVDTSYKIVVSLVYLVVSSFIAIMIMQKRDIK